MDTLCHASRRIAAKWMIFLTLWSNLYLIHCYSPKSTNASQMSAHCTFFLRKNNSNILLTFQPITTKWLCSWNCRLQSQRLEEKLKVSKLQKQILIWTKKTNKNIFWILPWPLKWVTSKKWRHFIILIRWLFNTKEALFFFDPFYILREEIKK